MQTVFIVVAVYPSNEISPHIAVATILGQNHQIVAAPCTDPCQFHQPDVAYASHGVEQQIGLGKGHTAYLNPVDMEEHSMTQIPWDPHRIESHHWQRRLACSPYVVLSPPKVK